MKNAENLRKSFLFDQKKIGFLAASLVWWIVPLCICLLFLVIYISVSDENASHTSHSRDALATFFESLFNLVAISGTGKFSI